MTLLVSFIGTLHCMIILIDISYSNPSKENTSESETSDTDETVMKFLAVSQEKEINEMTIPLHPTYIEHLKYKHENTFVILHDKEGNICNTTLQYLALKLFNVYDFLSGIVNEKPLKLSLLKEHTFIDLLYLVHRNLLKRTLNKCALEMYMKVLTKSKYDVLDSLEKHYNCKSRRELVLYHRAKHNFLQQINQLLRKFRTIISEGSIFIEKTFYKSSFDVIKRPIISDLTSQHSSSFEGEKLKTYEKEIGRHLTEFRKVLKARRKFFAKNIIKPGFKPEDVIITEII